MSAERTVTVAHVDLAAAFTEWDRRYREEPERFMSDVEHLLHQTPETYGDISAAYLLGLIAGDLPEPESG